MATENPVTLPPRFQFTAAGVQSIPQAALCLMGTVEFGSIHNPVSPVPRQTPRVPQPGAAAVPTDPKVDVDPDSDEDEEELEEDEMTMPVKLTARSGQPIEHWFWGKVAHDLSGFKSPGTKIPLDYAHAADANHSNVIGFCDMTACDMSTGNLDIPGTLVAHDGNIAGSIMKNGKAGIPYQASINFGGGGMQVEHVAEGEKAMVNGYEFEGPGAIIRKWPLRGVAMCLYGADEHTAAQFNNQGGDVPVSIIHPQTEPTPASKETVMSTTVTTEPVTPAKPSKEDFVKAFGKERAAMYLFDDKSFADAQADFAEFTKAEAAKVLNAKDDEIAELKKKLDNAPQGNEPASFDGGKQKSGKGAKKGTGKVDIGNRTYADGSPIGAKQAGNGHRAFAQSLVMPDQHAQRAM